MKLTVHQLRRLIRERLILELDLQPGVTLYHRSSDANLRPGTIIGGESSELGKGPHHRQKGVENALEDIRKKDFPDAPSRLTGAFATLQPATRFASYGHLYEVRAVGKTLVTDSGLIDKMWQEGDRALYNAREIYGWDDTKISDNDKANMAQHVKNAIGGPARKYWQGVSVSKRNIRQIEVVAEKLEILRKVEEAHRLMSKTIFKAPVALSGGPHWDSIDRIRRIEDDLKSVGCTVEYKKDSYREKVKVTIPQGTLVQICGIGFLGGSVSANPGHEEPEDYNPEYDAPLKNLDVIPMGMNRFPKGCESMEAAQSNEEPLSPVVLDKESIRAVVAAHKKGDLDIISRD